MARSFGLFLLAMLFNWSGLKAQPGLMADGQLNKVMASGSWVDFTIPTNIDLNKYPYLYLSAKGGDGGYSKFDDLGKIKTGNGGIGATLGAHFSISANGANDLHPGDVVRFIVGKKGSDTSNKPVVFGSSHVGGGGGGGTGIFVKRNGTWHLLMAAGGGGGGGNDQNANGTKGQGGIPDLVDQSKTSGGGTGNSEGGAGGGLSGDGAGGGRGGKKGWSGVPTGTLSSTIAPTGGAGGSGHASGGFGFGGGGAGDTNAGGGGGYYGGRRGADYAGTTASGGGYGGGSFINPNWRMNFPSRRYNGNTSHTTDGWVIYQFLSAPSVRSIKSNDHLTAASNDGLLLKNGPFELWWQGDGNLVLRDRQIVSGETNIWDSGAKGNSATLVFQSDGNLVIYNGGAIWDSGTPNDRFGGKGGQYLAITPDGNLIITNVNGRILWETATVGRLKQINTYGEASMAINTNLHISAANNSVGTLLKTGSYSLEFQGDGNLVLYRGTTALWASKTDRHPNSTLVFQWDGNIVIYDGGAIWDSGTPNDRFNGNGGRKLTLQPNGNLAIISVNGDVLWETHTGR